MVIWQCFFPTMNLTSLIGFAGSFLYSMSETANFHTANFHCSTEFPGSQRRTNWMHWKPSTEHWKEFEHVSVTCWSLSNDHGDLAHGAKIQGPESEYSF